MAAKSLSRVLFLVTPWTAAYQAPPSMGFSRQEYWSGLPLPSPCTNSKHFSTSSVPRSKTQNQMCQEPAQEIPPMTRSCKGDLISKASGLEGLPRPARASTPKPESVCLIILCLSPTLLTLTGGYPRPPFSGENQPRALANKSPGHERNISNQTPSVSILACLAGLSRLLQLCM